MTSAPTRVTVRVGFELLEDYISFQAVKRRMSRADVARELARDIECAIVDSTRWLDGVFPVITGLETVVVTPAEAVGPR